MVIFDRVLATQATDFSTLSEKTAIAWFGVQGMRIPFDHDDFLGAPYFTSSISLCDTPLAFIYTHTTYLFLFLLSFLFAYIKTYA